MFARGTAAEVFARQQDARAFIARFIQHELRVRLLAGVVEEAPIVEQVLAEAGTGHLLQKLLGNNGVGVDVGRIKGTTKPVC